MKLLKHTRESFNVLKEHLSTGWQIEQQLSQKQKMRYGNLKLLKLLKMARILIIRDFLLSTCKKKYPKKLKSIPEFEKEILYDIKHIQLSETRD